MEILEKVAGFFLTLLLSICLFFLLFLEVQNLLIVPFFVGLMSDMCLSDTARTLSLAAFYSFYFFF